MSEPTAEQWERIEEMVKRGSLGWHPTMQQSDDLQAVLDYVEELQARLSGLDVLDGLTVEQVAAMNHAPEPWRAGYHGEADRYRVMIVRAEEVDDQPYLAILPDTGHGWHEANAARIEACVNTCRGLTPEQVAAIPRLVAWFAESNRLGTPAAQKGGRQGWEVLETVFPPKGGANG